MSAATISLFLHLIALVAAGWWFAGPTRETVRYPVRLQVAQPAMPRSAPTPPAPRTPGRGPTADEAAARWRELLRKRPFGIPGTREWGAGTDTAEGEGTAGVSEPATGPTGAGFPEGKAGAFGPEEEPGGLAPLLGRPVAEADVPVAMDMLEVDAERRERTVILIDPKTRKLKKAYLHLPLYVCQASREIVETFRLLNDRLMRYRTPIECQYRWYRLGECMGWLKVPGFRDPDPIWSFVGCGERHILDHTEMAQYPVLFLQYIDVESTAAMAAYLARGGFAVVNRQQLSLLNDALRREFGARVRQLEVGLEHPLFHCEFDIREYVAAALPCCPYPVAPVPGLELDGRLVAVCFPPFVWRQCVIVPCTYCMPVIMRPECPSNLLYVNALVWGMIQPSRMGGRYWSAQ